MALVPSSGTNVRLLSDVPFSADYKNTRWFDNKSAQTTYFLGKPVVYNKAEHNFQRIEGSPIIEVQKSIDQIWNANYIMFQNEHYNAKWFYAFVTKLEYVQKNTTRVHFQLDVFQTWRFEMNFKPSFIVREHCKLWNSDGSPVINTVDEGLNYGTEYRNVATSQYKPNGGYKWLVFATKTPIHGDKKEVTPTVIGYPQPLSYYMIPFKDDNMTPSVIIEGESDGYAITPPTQVMKQLYEDEEAVNNVVAFYITDFTGIPVGYKKSSGDTPDVMTFPKNGNVIKHVVIGAKGSSIYGLYVEKVLKFSTIHGEIFPDKYSGYYKPKESKLLMYPYCMTVLDDFRGNRTVYKNEYIDSDNFYINLKGSLGTSNKVSYNVPDYNHSKNDGQSGETSNETALINNNPSDIPIITDMLSAYLQGNRNSIENQKSSIFWNGWTNLVGGAIGAGASAGGGNGIGLASSATGMIGGAGSTVLQLQGIEAKQKDIDNIPPQISKMGSNTSYDYGNGYSGVYAIKKQITSEYRKKLGDFFGMFGYKVNEVKLPNFHTRRHFNYVQTASCTITGNFPNEDLVELKQVFDNGITLWHTDDVGNYSLENEVI